MGMRKSSVAATSLSKILEARDDVFARMEKHGGAPGWGRKSFSDVRKVALILSAPRSGSSLLFSLLKRLPGIYAPSGECVPFFKLNGLSADTFPSDAIPDKVDSPSAKAGLFRDMLSDCSAAATGSPCDDPNWRESFTDDLALRLPMQWPGLALSYDIVRKAALGALAAHLKVSKGFCKEGFYLEFLARVRGDCPGIDPYYYDIPAGLIAERFPYLKTPSGPPNGVMTVEEPPFILLEPGRRVSGGDLAGKTLLLKSTINCYRMEFIRSLFPNAEMRAVYLIRNPLSSINGLCDGWLYRGFFSHNLKAYFLSNSNGFEGLSISGYSEKNEWGKWWWNFDLPPGWERRVEKTLEEVCAFQWASGNKAVQRALDRLAIPSIRVRFEDVAGGVETRLRVMRETARFLGADPESFEDSLLGTLPVVQATEPPAPLRWKKRKGALLPLLDDPETGSVAEGLGYV